MTDHRRSGPSRHDETEDRDSRAEALLVEGLDQYFSGRYEDAIHLWTRVLFLDRSHARARAYIDRARTALGERHRHADEMLHTTHDLVGRGDLAEARTLLARASSTTTDDERVAELWTRIERVERARSSSPRQARAAAVVDAVPMRVWSRTVGSAVKLLAAAALGALLVTATTSPALRDWFSIGVAAPRQAALPAARLPVLSSAEVILVRARTLYARGRLAEALQVLERTDVDSADRQAADALRVEIQQILLSTSLAPAPSRGARADVDRR